MLVEGGGGECADIHVSLCVEGLSDSQVSLCVGVFLTAMCLCVLGSF